MVKYELGKILKDIYNSAKNSEKVAIQESYLTII
jgi:hypothetical protein